MYFRFLGELSIWQRLITQMPTGVWWHSEGLSDLSSLAQNHAGFLLCDTMWNHIYFPMKCLTLSFTCSGFTGKHPSSRHPPGECSMPRSMFSFFFSTTELSLPWIDRELPMMQTCMTVSAYMSILALLSVDRCPLARHIQLMQWSSSVKRSRRRTGAGAEVFCCYEWAHEWEAENGTSCTQLMYHYNFYAQLHTLCHLWELYLLNTFSCIFIYPFCCICLYGGFMHCWNMGPL